MRPGRAIELVSAATPVETRPWVWRQIETPHDNASDRPPAGSAITPALAASEVPLPELPKLDDGSFGYQEVVQVDGVEPPRTSGARSRLGGLSVCDGRQSQLDDPTGDLVEGNFTISSD